MSAPFVEALVRSAPSDKIKLFANQETGMRIRIGKLQLGEAELRSETARYLQTHPARRRSFAELIGLAGNPVPPETPSRAEKALNRRFPEASGPSRAPAGSRADRALTRRFGQVEQGEAQHSVPTTGQHVPTASKGKTHADRALDRRFGEGRPDHG